MILFSTWHPCLWQSPTKKKTTSCTSPPPPAPCWWYEPSQWFWLPPRDVWTWYMAHQSLEMDLEVQWPLESSDIESWLSFKAPSNMLVPKNAEKGGFNISGHVSFRSRKRKHNKKTNKAPSDLPVVPSLFQPTKRIGMLPFQPLRRSSVTHKSLGPQKIHETVWNIAGWGLTWCL